MSRSCSVVDDMVREYLLFRGFTKTAQTLESEIKFDKDKSMRADKITDHLLSFVYGFDIVGLKDYWSHLNKRFFRRIPNTAIHNTLIKLENCLYKYYIINAQQSQKHDKVVEFFERFGGEILGNGNKDTWREWFSFPYVKNPELNPIFEPYFQQIWSATLHMSLQNFISTVLDAVPLPALLQWKDNTFDETEEKHQLQKELSVLKMKLQDKSTAEEGGLPGKQVTLTRSDLDIAEDFYIISAGRSPDTVRSPISERGSSRARNGTFTILNHKDYTEHTTPLTFAQFSCEGMFCATSDANGVLKVWTFSPEIKTLHSFVMKSGVFALHWARKIDKLLYVGTGDGKIKIVNISNRKISQELCHPTEGLRVISLASNLMATNLVSSATDPSYTRAEVVVWDCKTRELLQHLEITPCPSPVTSTHYNHNGNLLVSGAKDGMIRVYADYQCIMGWQAHEAPLHTVKFSVDENSVFSYCADGTLTQWRLYPMSQMMHSITINSDPSLCETLHFGCDFALDSEGKFLIAARGTQAAIYSIEGGIAEDSVLPSQGGLVTAVDWHVPYSTRLCLAATVTGIARITGLLN